MNNAIDTHPITIEYREGLSQPTIQICIASRAAFSTFIALLDGLATDTGTRNLRNDSVFQLINITAMTLVSVEKHPWLQTLYGDRSQGKIKWISDKAGWLEALEKVATLAAPSDYVFQYLCDDDTNDAKVEVLHQSRQ
jgi:hypothetical protein